MPIEESFLPIVWLQVDDDFREYLGLEPNFNGEVPALLWRIIGGSPTDETQMQLGDQDIVLGSLILLRAAVQKDDNEEELPIGVDELVRIIEWYRESYEFPTVEELVLSLADFAKENINEIIQLELLKSGQMLVPDSSEIETQLISIESRAERGSGH